MLHLCFGYAHVVPNKPHAYTFLTQLKDCVVREISIEAAQPKLDLSVLRELPGKRIHVGVIDLSTPTAETPEEVAGRIRAALAVLPAERIVCAPDCGMKYLSRELAFAKLKALIRKAATRSREALRNAIGRLVSRFEPHECAKYFVNADYALPNR